MESGLNVKEIEIGTTAESLELRFQFYIYPQTLYNPKKICHDNYNLKVIKITFSKSSTSL